MFSLDPRQ
ncbi:hypothetical protein AZE42_04665 [Rhizopogon vesiculosus]|uniref:Uncharacterized protein n=1 Tax=Rhizopogon vesiculosus TaxID=180088 RepID=A0A1J8PP83_9AGAM|nr:hypothetical protein AZE42_04665 [Rhizopogon vesiculosus]